MFLFWIIIESKANALPSVEMTEGGGWGNSHLESVARALGTCLSCQL